VRYQIVGDYLASLVAQVGAACSTNESIVLVVVGAVSYGEPRR
jgi:hypothetical protein